MHNTRTTYTLVSKFGTEWEVYLKFGKYSNNRIAINLLDPEDSSPIMTATVNLPEVPLSGDEIIVKDYSENEGVLLFLQSNGIVGPIKRTVRTGWVEAKIVDLLIQPS